MSRTSQIVIVIVLAAVVAAGGVLVARRQAESGGGGGAPASPGVIVYAPCGMSSPIAIATQRFREANPDVQINVVFDNSIVLVRKIRAGDRPDVFLSPGELEMKQLTQEGYIDGATVRDFGTLDIVIIAPSKTKLNTIRELTSPSIKQVSMADPKLNSVGWYAQKAFENMGLWEPLKGKLLPREYPLEAITLATTGKVDAGVAFLTCPLETAPDKADASDVRVVEKFPRDSYPPVRLQLGILKESKKRDLGQRYIDFITSEAGQKAVATNGIRPAKEIQ
jgi:molybdate transport system substrate-binding protein